jgi:hypothetical protein
MKSADHTSIMSGLNSRYAIAIKKNWHRLFRFCAGFRWLHRYGPRFSRSGGLTLGFILMGGWTMKAGNWTSGKNESGLVTIKG